jgi:putative ATP-binding cassette transporter
MNRARWAVLKDAWRLAKAYWVSEEKWMAWRLLVIIISINLIMVYINVLINKWYNTFYEVMSQRDYSGFVASIKEFSLLAGIFVAIAGYQIYLKMRLSIYWRRWLTKRLIERWLGNKTYYRLMLLNNNTDNPDQRISEDINLFVSYSLNLTLGLLVQLVSLVSFIVILWNLSGIVELPIGKTVISIEGSLVWAALIYAGAGTYLTTKLGKPLVKLNFNQQRYEADFRFNMMRLRENCESIALYSGEKQEAK